jgi:diguanylate cyclase (GGDEF)-like protein/PAS domain S-box-containing protein
VSDSALERHRLQKSLRRGGFEAAAGVDPWASRAEIERVAWDLVIWTSGPSESLARDILRQGPPGTPVLLVLDARASASAVASALDAGFADVVRGDAPCSELLARARGVARRSAAVRALAAEAGAFRELAEGGRDLLARQAPDGTVRYASRAAGEILGWDPADLVGRRAADLLPLNAAAPGADPYVHRVRRRDGGSVWMETTTRLIHDASGRIHEVHTDSRDVSDRMQADAERASVTRVTAAVAEGGAFERIAYLIARESALLAGTESAALVRFHGDEGLVLGATGPVLRAGERIPITATRAGGLVAPVVVAGLPWGVILARGLGPAAGRELRTERLRRLAPLVSLAVSNSRSRERLVALAATDALTGLTNHGAFHTRLEEECSRAWRAGAPLSLVLIDLDHFKRVNDTHGHQAGDEVLREVARRLTTCARLEDVVGRVGGEELAWLLPCADLDEAMEAAERLRCRIADHDFATVGRLTGSLGVATLGEGTSAELARRADVALYRAKDGGRNACVRWVEDDAITAARSA